MKRPKHRLYNVAETLFVEQGMTCAAIAGELSIREATLSEWRNGMKWDEQRQRHLSTPGVIRQMLLEAMERVAKGEKSKIDTDALSKIGKALTYFDGKVALNIVISVFKDFNYFMADHHPHKAVDFLKYIKQFIHERAKAESYK